MVTFTVRGTPGPQGSKKFVGLSKAGRGILVESSAKVKPWRYVVQMAAEGAKAAHGGVIRGPVWVSMVFTLKKPLSTAKRVRTWPATRPDLSKLVRSTEDAITDAGLWEDDARVVEYGRLAKVYAGEDVQALDSPGVVVYILPMSEMNTLVYVHNGEVCQKSF